jgi:hypothetical protein
MGKGDFCFYPHRVSPLIESPQIAKTRIIGPHISDRIPFE